MAKPKREYESRAFKDLPIAGSGNGPIDLGELAERIRRGRTPDTRRGVLSSAEPAIKIEQHEKDESIEIPIGETSPGNSAIFAAFAERYKAAQEQNKLTQWQGVRDFIMEHFHELIATRLVSFRDLMNAALDIDQKMLKGRDNIDDDPLAPFERWWVKPDAEVVISPVNAVTTDEDAEADE